MVKYTVDKICDDVVVLENRDNREIINKDIKEFERNIKECDIVIYDDTKKLYVIDQIEIDNVKKSIRNRFNRLKK